MYEYLSLKLNNDRKNNLIINITLKIISLQVEYKKHIRMCEVKV